MTRQEALDLLHTALWSLVDNHEMLGAWEVEDIYIRFESFTREHRLEMAAIIRNHLRASAIFEPKVRRVKGFLFWLLTTTEGP